MRKFTARFTKTAEAQAFAAHIVGPGWSAREIAQKGRTVTWVSDSTDPQYRSDMQETVHYFGSPEFSGARTKSNTSWIVSVEDVEPAPVAAPAATEPTTETTRQLTYQGRRAQVRTVQLGGGPTGTRQIFTTWIDEATPANGGWAAGTTVAKTIKGDFIRGTGVVLEAEHVVETPLA